MKASISGKKLKAMMLYMSDHAKLFHGLKPAEMAQVARSNNLGNVLPTNKEGMAILVYALRMMKSNPQSWPMVREITMDDEGKVVIVAGGLVDQNDLNKIKTTIQPESEMTRVAKQLKRFSQN